jgi:hypothetical protein
LIEVIPSSIISANCLSDPSGAHYVKSSAPSLIVSLVILYPLMPAVEEPDNDKWKVGLNYGSEQRLSPSEIFVPPEGEPMGKTQNGMIRPGSSRVGLRNA